MIQDSVYRYAYFRPETGKISGMEIRRQWPLSLAYRSWCLFRAAVLRHPETRRKKGHGAYYERCMLAIDDALRKPSEWKRMGSPSLEISSDTVFTASDEVYLEIERKHFDGDVQEVVVELLLGKVEEE